MSNPLPIKGFAPLPKSFMFGVATADHQCEAYDSRYEDIRDVWERRRALTVRGQATDFWNRYAEDIALAQSLGCKAFRFSIAWSRVEPKPGEFSEEAFEHYRQAIATIRSHNMEPIVTLHHFTHPVHVEARGGLTSPDFPAIFANYTTEVAKRLGPLARYWISFNEPSQLIYGYVKPWWERAYFMPPGLDRGASIADQMTAVQKLMRNLFVAHTRARTILQQVNPDAQVGANPMLLGLPLWLQRLVDRNVTNLRRPEDLVAQGKRFTERALLEKGQVDVVIATLTVTPERQQEVAFSEAYFQAGQILLVKSDSAIQQLEDCNGKSVAVIKSSTAESTVDKLLPAANIQVVDDYTDALRALDYEQISAILIDDVILLGVMEQYPGKYRLVGNNGDRLTVENYAAAVVKGDRALLNVVDVAVRYFKESGDWQASFTHYFPNLPVPPVPKIGRRSTLADITTGSASSLKTTFTQRLPLAKPGTPLRRIQDRGHLIVAVKDNVPGFGYRDPNTKEFSGLEIDLARTIAKQIFGDPSKVKFYAVSTQERLPVLHSIARIFDPALKLFSVLSTSLTSNWWHLGMAGQLPTFLCPQECVGQQDFVGFDYYWGISNLRLNRIQQLMDAAFGRFGNAPVWSGVLYDMLKFHAQLFPGKEILIIENGCVDVADKVVTRVDYLRQHVQQVQRARQDGVNVVGYLAWCITSNREWGLKFGPDSDFGLYHIDLDTDLELKRQPTFAVAAYQEIINKGGV
ncbi:family 1 glycosylhydrolase [Nostocaceae cyanobacterium CENA369]|uniref:Family 1 glycosylhydrolase n=1 Tax=Dendronalium phyllosphericum CENA369 TaxID=1725256 RepID=A0A8J7I0J3_9NOST|nr:family 1 glycosylhydrolase [Dendronalium phyllosphericum]MBH8573586.1 family 1 glycosylhydrolase [Dendronalium phyllosphericum CENA369]